jgi:uncharacterized protein
VSRIFWDTMLFIYLLEGNKKYSHRVRELLERSYERGDTLLTSYLALGEIMAGEKHGTTTASVVRTTIEEMGFSFVSFDGRCLETFRHLRSQSNLRAPDAIHLACAAAADVDLFLTGDVQLLNRRLHMPGVKFIADFGTPLF